MFLMVYVLDYISTLTIINDLLDWTLWYYVYSLFFFHIYKLVIFLKESFWLPISSAPNILKKIKTIFASFTKSWNKILKVANDLSRECAKSQLEMFCILSYTKMTNLTFLYFEITILTSTIFSCLCSSKYILFRIEILPICGIHHWLRHDLFLVFFETQKYVFLTF